MGYSLADIIRNVFLGRKLLGTNIPLGNIQDEEKSRLQRILKGHGVNRKATAKRRRATKLKKLQQKHMRAVSRGAKR